MIFSNIIDNSIKACFDLEDDKKNIKIVAKARNYFFYIYAENFYDENLFRKGQGIGLSSIKLITKKYNGEMETCFQNGKFNISIILPFSN